MTLAEHNPARAVLAALDGGNAEPERGRAAAEAIEYLSANRMHDLLTAASDYTATTTWTRLVLRLIEVREQHLPPPTPPR